LQRAAIRVPKILPARRTHGVLFVRLLRNRLGSVPEVFRFPGILLDVGSIVGRVSGVISMAFEVLERAFALKSGYA
jgi:hypothetical protein